MKLSFLLVALGPALAAAAFVHPGLLHTDADFQRVRSKVIDTPTDPWLAGWYKLTNSTYAQAGYTPRPVETLCRGVSDCTQNYPNLYRDAAAAYALGLRYRISGDTQYADTAVTILNAWATTLKQIWGSSDKFLASGLYGYQLANAVELLRGYDGFSAQNLTAITDMLVDVFYPMNHAFLTLHNGAKIDHYWANWDLCNMASMMSIGVLADNQTMYDEALDYFYNGGGNGAINKTIWVLYDDGTGQVQESGRDQGHTMLDIALLGVLAQTAYNQGTNLYAYEDYRILRGAEYAAKYNLGNDVQYTTYVNSDVTQTVISNNSRGNIRPIWDQMYNHYVKVEGQAAPYAEQYADLVRTDGGGADAGGGYYGTTSGGFDQLGYTTLMFTL